MIKMWGNPYFEMDSSYPEVDTFPLMRSALPVALITVGYLLFVLKIGPAMMKNRKPFELKNIIIAYNAFQVMGALYNGVRGLKYLAAHGIVHSKCYADNDDMRKEFFTLNWLFFIIKITELLDTVFFVLRKKDNQVSFLHVYHHTLMMAGTWAFLKLAPHDNLVFMGFVNSLVHVFMYGYYAMSAVPRLAKLLWWKKYITTLQLVQFVAVFFHYQIQLCYSPCPPPRFMVFIAILNNFLMMFLFTKFYIDNYRKNGGLEAKKEKSISNGNGHLMKDNMLKAQ